MTTAQLRAPSADEVIRANVRALLRVRKQPQAALARHMGWDDSTMSKVMKGDRHFWARQLVDVARFFEVEAGVLYAATAEELAGGLGMTLEELLGELKNRCSTELTSVEMPKGQMELAYPSSPAQDVIDLRTA